MTFQNDSEEEEEEEEEELDGVANMMNEGDAGISADVQARISALSINEPDGRPREDGYYLGKATRYLC